MGNINFESVAIQWKNDKSPLVKPATYAVYCQHLWTHILPAFGDGCCPKEEDLQAFALRLLKEGRSPKTVRDILQVIRQIIGYGQKTG